MGSRTIRCIAALSVVLGGCLAGCPAEDDVECVGEDHRPEAPVPGNACHESFTLLVRADECVAGLFDEPTNQGLTGRNATLAGYYTLADHATADELAQCEIDADMHRNTIAQPDCAAPSTQCGPAPDTDNACHDYYEAMAEYRLRCDPETFAADGMEGHEAFLAAWLARADYATADEQQSPCTSGIDFWLGDCIDN